MKRLGDKIERLAKPIAKTIDAIWGSDLVNCTGCNKMRDNLNSGMTLTDALWERFWPKQQEENKMQFQVNRQIVVEADDAEEALKKTKPTEGTTVSFNVVPRPAAATVGRMPQSIANVRSNE